MRLSQRAIALLLWALFIVGLPASAWAQNCKINSVTSVTITGFSPSSYAASTSPQTLSATLTITVDKAAGNNSGCASLAFAYTGASPVLTNGASQLPFTLSATAGGTSIVYPSGGSPSATYVFLTGLPNAIGIQSLSTTVYLNIPGLTVAQINALVAGTYSTSLTAQVFSGTVPNAGLSHAMSFSVTVTVPRVCTVGGTSTPTTGSASIPIVNGRVSSVAPITPTLPLGTSVVCTGVGAVSVSLSSQNVRLAGPTTSNPAFASAINYSATASVAGGTAATYTSTTGVATAGTAGGTSGALSVSITPVDPGKPLVSGTYTDVLRITITPQ